MIVAKARKYYIVVGKSKDSGKWEMLFGDYDRQVALDDSADLKGSFTGVEYQDIHVVMLPEDNAGAIRAKLDELNKGL